MSKHRNKKRKKKSPHSPKIKLQLLTVAFLILLAAGTYSGAKEGTFISKRVTYTSPITPAKVDVGTESTPTPIISPAPSPTPNAVPTITPALTPVKIPASTITQTNFEEIRHGDTSKKQVIFTFDAGSGNKSAPGILAALSKRGLKSTFFFTGHWIENNPVLAKQIVDAGHEVFNHSYSHPYFTKLTPTEITLELEKMDDLLASTTGVRTKPYFRAPYGDRNDIAIKAAADAGYRSIYWDVDGIDWRDGETTETIKNRVLNHIHSGAIVLLHVGDIPTGDVIEEIFTEVEARGYKIVSLTEGL